MLPAKSASQTRILGLAIVLLVAGVILASVFPVSAQMTRFEDRTDPVLLVASYYNAINLQDYERAFSYWINPPASTPTLTSFEQGFSVTARVAPFAWVPVYVDAGAGNLFAQVPVLLVSQLVDGTEQYYAGCFIAHKANVPVGDATEPDPNWSLQSATLTRVQRFDISLLQTSCEEQLTLADARENLSSPVSLLTSYFGAITSKDYASAFSYWETPPASTPTLASFAAGYAETDTVSIILRLDVSMEGAAGSSYASVPALVISTLNDGTIQHFTGCYVARQVNVPVGDATEPDPNWYLYDAHVEAASNISNGFALLQDTCGVEG